MAVTERFRIEGAKQVDEALSDLKKATGKNVIRRGEADALEPVAEAARGYAHVLSGKLRGSVKVSTKLSASQKPLAAETASYVETYMGPEHPAAKAIVNEFGSYKMAAQPFMRPAWDGAHEQLLANFIRFLWEEISKSAARAQRKALKASR